MAVNASTNSTLGEIVGLFEAGQSNVSRLDLTNARKSWEEGLAKAEGRLAADDPLIGLFLARLELCYYADDRPKAFECFKRALTIAEKHFDSDGPVVALLLTEVGWVCNNEGQPDKALVFFHRALAAAEKAFGRERWSVERCVMGQITVYEGKQNFEQALPACQRLLAIRESTSGKKSLNYADGLDRLAAIYEQKGEFDQALILLNSSFEIKQENQGTNSHGAALALEHLARFYERRGNLQQSATCYQRSLAIEEHIFGPEGLSVAWTLSSLAALREQQQNYDEALSLRKRVLAIMEKLSGPEGLDLAQALDRLATVYQGQGDYARALPLFKQCLLIREKLYGREHLSVAKALNNLALLYEDQGNYAEVIPLLQRSLAIREKVVGPRHPLVAEALLNLGGVLWAHGQNADALPLVERGLEISEETQGPDHELTTSLLNILAPLYEERGDRQTALALYERCLAAREKTFGTNSHLVAISLSNLASFYLRGGEDARAIMFYRRSLAVLERVLGKAHPNTCVLLGNLAVAEKNAGNPSEALSLLATAFRRQRGYLVTQFSQSTWRDALRAQERVFSKADALHTLCMASKVPERASLGAEQLSLSKAVLEEVQATQAALEADPRTATRERLAQCQSVQAELKHLLESKPEPTQRDAKRQALEVELSQLEGKLAESVGLVAQTLRERNLTFLDIARNVPPQGALADFIQYRRYDFTAEETNRWKEQRYATYMTLPLARDSTNLVVERVDLGEAAPIDEAVEFICKRMCSGMGYKRDDVTAALQRLGDLVYAPLAKHLTSVSHLIVCPDGQLSRVPFEMLRVGGRFLIEEKTISYVTSGREIVRLEGSLKSKVQSLKSLVMGGPDFDLDLSKAGSASFQLVGSAGIPARSPADAKQDALPLPGGMPALRSLSRDYRGIKFPALPGAEAEARSVAKLLGGDCVLRVGPEAREAELKAAVSPRVLHLATHGFFLSDQEFRRTNSLPFEWPGEWGQAGRRPNVQNDWENPLVRCGIALAGANHAGQITNAVAEDGLLTGLEASLLNLQGTELVILSAYDSGTGEVQIGEGVMSLRRAFRIAGAQTVLASHWKVSDKATSQLMTEFIRRWRSGEPRAKAWREAQLSLLHSNEFQNPFFWAAFTLTGQWR